jgi:ubiquinone biosynthesis protein
MPNEDLDRYRRVAVALTRHGLTRIADLLGLDSGLLAEVRAKVQPGGVHSLGEDLASTLEELGPTYIKLGQLLSTREDLVPPEVAAALARLQDHTPPAPYEEIRRTIVAELGRPPEELFARFDEQPLACASIGQAHAARMKGGDEVVVKVRRPGAVAQVKADLRLMRHLVEEADRSSAKAHQLGLLPFVEQFSATTLDELDYRKEAANARRFADMYRDEPRIHIPRVHPRFSTGAVLTLDRVRGLRVDDIEGLDRHRVDRRRLARLAATTLVEMVVVHRFFHADPHPGNLFVQDDGSITLIDFGMVGRVTEGMAEQLDDLILAFVAGDAERLTDAVLEVAESSQSPDRQSLERSLGDLLDTVRSSSLARVEVSRVGRRMLALMRRHHLRLPGAFDLLAKLVFQAEGLGRRLDPDFSMIALFQPYAQQILERRLDPRHVARRAARAGADAAWLGVEGPAMLRRLLKQIASDGMRVQVPVTELEPLVGRAERLGNRMVAGMLAAAVLQGMVPLVQGMPRLRRWTAPMLALGVVAGGALSGYLAVSSRPRRLED